MRTRKATLADVARQAGVSTATVDRVLNGRGGVSPERQERVIRAAREIDLDRNLARVPVRPLRFAAIMNRPVRNFYVRIRTALAKYEQMAGGNAFSCSFHFFESQDPQTVASRIESTRRNFDGAIVIAYEHPLINEALRRMSGQVPVVTLITDLPNSGRLDYVGVDSRSAGRFAGDLMGRFVPPAGGRLLIITGNQSYVVHEEREMGFRQVLRERHPDLKVSNILECREVAETDIEMIRDYVRDHGPFEGFYNISSWNNRLIPKLAAFGLVEGKPLISHGTSRDTRRLLADGTLDAVIDDAPETLARHAIDRLLFRHGRAAPPNVGQQAHFDVYMRERLPPEPAEPA